jgi:aldose 1-epimerase
MPRKLALLAVPLTMTAAPYTAEKITVEGIEVVRLADTGARMEILVAPSIGNNAYSMKVNGSEIFFSPYKTLTEWKAKPVQIGNPFLSPWVNRISEDSYWANGKRYLLNGGLNNFRRDAFGQPIHGLVVYAGEWKVTGMKADAQGAAVTSRLEFWRHPDRMAQFPFAHNVEMTYRLSGGALEVATAVENLSAEPMPLSHGYHTYYTIPGVPRDAWRVHLPAKEHVELSSKLVPTGTTKPVSLPDPAALAGTQLDDVFTGLSLTGGRSLWWVEGGGKRITVEFGPRYTVGVVYAPQGREFICFEPMTGVTNQFNLAHDGKFSQLLQSVPPGQTWSEIFRVSASGF